MREKLKNNLMDDKYRKKVIANHFFYFYSFDWSAVEHRLKSIFIQIIIKTLGRNIAIIKMLIRLIFRKI